MPRGWTRGGALVVVLVGFIMGAAAASGQDGERAWPRSAAIRGAPGDADLVVFIARTRPFLYRLVGNNAVPWSSARFYDPVALVGSPKDRCFYVLDRAKLAKQPFRVWRIEPNGRALVQHRDDLGSRTHVLGVDAAGRVLVGDVAAGLKRFDADGQFRPVVPEGGPIRFVGAVTAAPDGSLLLGCNYIQEVSEQGHLRSQGGLYRLRNGRPELLLENRERGGGPADTHWRGLRGMVVDSGGRVVLCDIGVTSRQEVTEYSGARRQPPRKRVHTAEVAGGLLVLHPDGRFEDLTFKGGRRRGRVLRPHGVAEWAPGAFLVADPTMPAERVEGTGGLAIVHLDGHRSAPWPFGWRRQPVGVAVLRGAGKAAGATPPALGMMHLAGIYRGETPTGLARVAGRRVAKMKRTIERALSPAEIRKELTEIFVGARWIIGPAGTILFAAPGEDPDEDGPTIMRGEVRIEHHAGLFQAACRKRTRTDSAMCFVRGSLVPGPKGTLRARVFLGMTYDNREFHAEVDQVLTPQRLPRRPPTPAPAIPRDALPGEFRAAAPGRFLRCAWTRMVLEGRPGSPTYGLYKEKKRATVEEARERCRRLLTGARLLLGSKGAFIFSPPGVDPGENRPDVFRGTWHLERHVVELRGQSRPRRLTDTSIGEIRGTVAIATPRQHVFRLWVRIQNGDDEFEAEFEVAGERQGTPPGGPGKQAVTPVPPGRPVTLDLSSPEATTRSLIAACRARNLDAVTKLIAENCSGGLRKIRLRRIGNENFIDFADFFGKSEIIKREEGKNGVVLIKLRCAPRNRTAWVELVREGKDWRIREL